MPYGSGGYLVNKYAETAKVKAVVNAAIKLGIYVIIDFHYTGDILYIKEAKEFFHEMSFEYKGTWNVLYEIYNEAINHSWQELKSYHETIIQVNVYLIKCLTELKSLKRNPLIPLTSTLI